MCGVCVCFLFGTAPYFGRRETGIFSVVALYIYIVCVFCVYIIPMWNEVNAKMFDIIAMRM